MQVGRLSYKCPCGAWRWRDRAESLGEEHCRECGRPFTSATVEFYPWSKSGPRAQSGHRQGRQCDPKGNKGHSKGANAGGKGGTGASSGGPKAPGRQQNHLQSGHGGPGGKGAGAGAEASRGANGINYKRAKNDPVYRAQSYLDTAKELFGANSKEATAAAQAVDEARKEADSRKTPAQRATDLRADRITYIDAIAERVQRIKSLQVQHDELSAEAGAPQRRDPSRSRARHHAGREDRTAGGRRWPQSSSQARRTTQHGS